MLVETMAATLSIVNSLARAMRPESWRKVQRSINLLVLQPTFRGAEKSEHLMLLARTRIASKTHFRDASRARENRNASRVRVVR